MTTDRTVPENFSAPTRSWFAGAFAAPTPAQSGAWEAIGAGDHALVVAPTGSGKTLSAFLWSVDRLLTGPEPQRERRARVLYVSPLKALATDIERNLRSPLVGITRAAESAGIAVRDVTVGVRTGDTPPAERRSLATRPPDILITTPESLYLVLTSGAREGLRGIETVIVDEVHAVAGTKRGAHLALTLERLDALLLRPAQRIGLSATVRPVETVARFLGGARTPADGGRPVRVVRPAIAKELQIDVVVPVPDLTELPEPAEHTPSPPTAGPPPAAGAPTGPAPTGGTTAGPDLSGNAAGSLPRSHRASIWPHVEERLVDLITSHRSTIVFANSRRGAERLAARVNEVWAQRQPGHGVEETPAAGHAATWAAQVPGQSGTALPASAHGEIARAHHGSMSREERTRIETELKAGRLPAVIATSTLELGIDMGAVDLVVQVGAPPSVASALQRIGRAGHQVGALSRGVVLPTHRGDLLAATVTSIRAQEGTIEELQVVTNPLDVLAQHVVAMLAVDDWSVADLAQLVRRSVPFESLGDASLHAVLDMLAGRYPSEDFAELRPRVVWDRSAGLLTARPGALRLATTSGGTIPDRGLYGVFLAGSATEDGAGAVTAAGRGGRRVGELDEEMVFESRVGDTFTLGSSTWRIEDITPDRVLVSPATGLPGRLPFWKGDSPGRPAELGRALGAFVRTTAALPTAEAHAQLTAQGLDDWSRDNLLGYLGEQREHAHLSDDRTIVLERFRDELGDWRLVLHSPFGARVHTPWALVLAARLRERLGMDVAAMPADDGIVLRLPDVSDGDALPVGAEDLLLDPSQVTGLVVEALAGSAHFAARFREAAARALLLPRRRPDRRQPLWQQRHRAAQLLGVAADHPDFPIVLEAVRECLRDDFDTPALTELMDRVVRREIRVLEVATATPSPFARTLLLGYVGQFLYDGDAPVAERRAAALALDPTLLAELVGPGAADLAELLDPQALADIEAEVSLRRYPATSSEGLADLVRRLGPATTAELTERCEPAGSAAPWLEELARARRTIRVTVAGEERWAVVEDAARLRDGLGVALPPGIPEDVLEPVADPLGDLVRRYARTHGPFAVAELAAHLGTGPAALAPVLRRLTAAATLVTGRLRPGGEGEQYCDTDVLRRVRRRSLAVLRSEVEAVPATTLGAFLPRWQQVGRGSGTGAVASVVDQLAGARMPASALEPLVLPARVPDYRPVLLDELITAGEVLWCGAGTLPGVDGYLVLVPADSPELLPAPLPPPADGIASVVLEVLTGGAYFFRDLLIACRERDDAAQTTVTELLEAVWELVWAGHVTNDTLAPVRARLSGGRPAHASPRRAPRAHGALSRRRALVAAAGARPEGPLPPAAAGRWSLVPRSGDDRSTSVVLGRVAALLERHGVLTRGAAGLEDLPGGFATAYPVLTRLEDAGKVRRGYLVEGLGAAQFALPECVDLLRDTARNPGDTPLLLAATDPASPYGAALPWPEPTVEGARPRRAAGAVVVLVGGELCLYVERGGRSLLSFPPHSERLTTAAEELARAAASGSLGRVTLQRIDGEPALGATGPVRDALDAAGFFATPRGLRLREGRPAPRDGVPRAGG